MGLVELPLFEQQLTQRNLRRNTLRVGAQGRAIRLLGTTRIVFKQRQMPAFQASEHVIGIALDATADGGPRLFPISGGAMDAGQMKPGLGPIIIKLSRGFEFSQGGTEIALGETAHAEHHPQVGG